MAAMRKALFWVHLVSGVSAGLLILSLALSGALLAFAPQALELAEAGQRRLAEAAPERSRLAAGSLLAALQRARPGVRPISLTLERDPAAAALVSLGRDGVLYLDPRSGELLGKGAPALRAGLRLIEDWHRWLALSGSGRDVGRSLTGGASLVFLLLWLSGLLLWLPARWSRTQLAAISWFRPGLAGRARDFNWHNVIGLWSAPLLLLLIGSGLAISYPTAADRILGLPEKPRPDRRGEPREQKLDVPVLPAESLDRLWGRAERQMPGWHTLTLRVPRSDESVSFTIQGQPRGARAFLTLDPRDNRVMQWDPPESWSAARRVRAAVRSIHTGEIGGLPGQALATLASLGACVLVWTGLALAVRRFSAWRMRRSAA